MTISECDVLSILYISTLRFPLVGQNRPSLSRSLARCSSVWWLALATLLVVSVSLLLPRSSLLDLMHAPGALLIHFHREFTPILGPFLPIDRKRIVYLSLT